jgi:hypothetical protein
VCKRGRGGGDYRGREMRETEREKERERWREGGKEGRKRNIL